LNRWSLGAVSRRFGRGSRSELLPHARDLTPAQARTLLARSGGARLRGLRSRCALVPARPTGWLTGIPIGDVVGVAALLEEGSGAPAMAVRARLAVPRRGARP
jgi:hypothetical protein